MSIEFYSWAAPNGHKVHIMLEETGIPYNVHPINIQAGDQFDPEFLKISPNNKIPAIVDPDGPGGQPITMFETGAILVYLGEKSGQFYPSDPRGRYETLCWLMFQMGSVGPMFGQNHHFRRYAPQLGQELTYALERYGNETNRIYGVMDKRLSECEWLAGDDYTIADMATFAWVRLRTSATRQTSTPFPASSDGAGCHGGTTCRSARCQRPRGSYGTGQCRS